MPEMSPLERDTVAIIRMAREQAGTDEPERVLAWLAAYVALTNHGISHGFIRAKLDPSKIVPGGVDPGKPHL